MDAMILYPRAAKLSILNRRSFPFCSIFPTFIVGGITIHKGNFGAVESPRLWACNVESPLLCWMRAHFRGHALPRTNWRARFAPRWRGYGKDISPPPFGAIFCPSRAAQRCIRAAIFQGIPPVFSGGITSGKRPGIPRTLDHSPARLTLKIFGLMGHI